MDKITLPIKPLTEAVLLAVPVLASKPSMPVLGSVCVYAQGGSVFVKATDLETTVILKVEGIETDLHLGFILGRSDGVEVLKSLKSDFEEMEVKIKKGGIELTTTTAAYKFSTDPYTDYPINIGLGSGEHNKVKVNKNILQKIVDKFPSAASTDEMRPNMRGVNMRLESGLISFCSTDTQQMLYAKTTAFGLELKEQKNFLIPLKSLAILKKLLKEYDGDEVTVKYDKKYIQFSTDGFIMDSILIAHAFPNFLPIVQQPKPYVIEVENKAALVKPLKRLLKSTKTGFTDCSLDFGEVLTIEHKGFERRTSGKEQVAGIKAPETFNISIKGDYLLNALEIYEGDRIDLAYSTSRETVHIRGVGEKDEGLLALIFPVMPTI